ncbi:protein phosphatase CheZ [Phreatobacter sp. AB_2022a]|uniref:protein phosphatase CheZ n=1 Tax=Phreatobacter sp. AB_2022a TaxID=3003134 RepID=UPI00228768C0|nr:protein phosphatase CheZ [Phreatobacter sp. AB_2022a]MCZ0737160.1 protein phosphatase CheZ [Phreatobacter sp. AB_2022a]
MRASKKAFRIESFSQPADIAWPMADGTPAGAGHLEIMAELKSLRALIQPAEEVSRQMIEAYRSEMQEALKLKAELDSIYSAINQTKHEIATLHVSGFQGKQMTRVTHELDAIVSGTEEATEGILSAAETIDQIAGQLAAKLKSQQDRGAVDDIQQKIITIFEHCNFQDLTGQRITKVVNTLKFIEERIVRMMDIWGGIDSFRDVSVEAMAEATGDAGLVNGPKLQGEAGHASQDEIDALFN